MATEEMPVTVIGIDPGMLESGWVEWDPAAQRVIRSGVWQNAHLVDLLRDDEGPFAAMGIEKVIHYGRVVGEPTFETVYWTGRFVEAWMPRPFRRVVWRDVARYVCDTTQGIRESHVRQALLDRFGPGRRAAVGVKKQPGPLYGVAGHAWSALAVALVVAECEHLAPS